MATTNLLHPLTLLALATVLLAGCAQLGPRALSEGRPLYNVAVQRTEAEQLLLNIVRQRYSDPVLFLDVTSIASGFSGQANVGWSSRVFESVTETASAVLGGSLRENPNIFYAPNTGEKFVRQMLTPLSIEKLALVLQAGWSIERVLLMSGESMNKLRNTPQSRVSDAGTPRYRAALVALRELQRDGELFIGAAPGEEGVLAITVKAIARERLAFREACELLEISCEEGSIRVRAALARQGDGETIALATRSLFSTLYYLSRSVDVPEQDLRAGLTSGGGARDAYESFFRVHSSAQAPERAAVAIHYRDSWFYISDDDIDSKVTFALLSMLVTLQSGDSATLAPLLALPTR